MAYYEKVKQSDDGQPVWESYLAVILPLIQAKTEWKSRDLKAAAIEKMELPKDLREKRYENASYVETVAQNRAGFALSLLKNAGLVDFRGSAKYAPNKAGKKFLKINNGVVEEKRIKQLPAYLEHRKLVEERRKSSDISGKETHEIPVENTNEIPIDAQMRTMQQEYNNSVATELLERIWEMNPYSFEGLVVDLLSAMGYKGENGSSFVTQHSNDGGIDGVINQDPLGTQTVYVQAKRYGKKNTVQRQEVSSFYGAIAESHSNKGVFITSSSFTKGALAAAKQLGILTIDGIQLTGLMVQYQVGVRTRHKYELYDVDEDFFEAE